MSAKARFTEADVKRASAGCIRAGIAIGKIEIDPNGKIVIIPASPTQANRDKSIWADLD